METRQTWKKMEKTKTPKKTEIPGKTEKMTGANVSGYIWKSKNSEKTIIKQNEIKVITWIDKNEGSLINTWKWFLIPYSDFNELIVVQSFIFIWYAWDKILAVQIRITRVKDSSITRQ